jgi:hypothetical protein
VVSVDRINEPEAEDDLDEGVEGEAGTETASDAVVDIPPTDEPQA